MNQVMNNTFKLSAFFMLEINGILKYFISINLH